MATYAIGDIQGCYRPLRCLLDEVAFDPDQDKLWLAGDIVNRGPQSLDCLRFLKSLGDCVIAVLGNHDLHCLAVAWGFQNIKPSDTLNELLAADDRDELLNWLRMHPLIHRDRALGFTMVHAGVPPIWTLTEAVAFAEEIEQIIHGEGFAEFLAAMYGNEPAQWSDSLKGPDRWRLITNYFTRMRFCDASGQLDLSCKLGPEHAPPGFSPWFKHPHRLGDERLIFGHWASLEGKTHDPKRFALDTGCVWGRQLTMLRLEDERVFSCECGE